MKDKKKIKKKVKKLSIDEQIEKAAKLIREKAGIDKLEEKIKNIAGQKYTPALTPKMKEILGGVDLTNKSELTKEQKIVGFFHALVTRDEPVLKALSEGTAADGGYGWG